MKRVLILSLAFLGLTLAMTGCWAINKNIDTDNAEADLSNAIKAKKSDQEATLKQTDPTTKND